MTKNKNIFQILGGLLINIGLWILSLIGSLLFLVFGISYTVIKGFVKVQLKTGLRRLSLTFLRMAEGVDLFGNIACPDLWNDIFLLPTAKHKFGLVGEYMSSVFGKGKRDDVLTDLGKWVAKQLDKVDDNHCLDSIQLQYDYPTSKQFEL